MITRSNCCQAAMHTVNGGEGTSYWVCAKCGKPCDPVGEEPRMAPTDSERQAFIDAAAIAHMAHNGHTQLGAEKAFDAAEILWLERVKRRLAARKV